MLTRLNPPESTATVIRLMLVCGAVLLVTLDLGQAQERPVEPQTVVRDSEASANADERNLAPTLRGEGKSRQMLLKGRVTDGDGSPARNFQISVSLNQQSGTETLPVIIRKNEFQTWIPVGGDDSFYLVISASTIEAHRRVNRGIQIHELRQAAIEGVVLQLADADRSVRVSVAKNQQPVAGAHVVARTADSVVVQGVTNDEGDALLHMLDGEKLRQLTAWTDDYLIGGYSFNRKPRRDPLGEAHVVELEDCRNQTVRFLRAEDNSPVADIAFRLIIGTGSPNHNFPAVPDTFPQLHMVTNEQGEEERYSDHVYAFTDTEGNFTADCIPGSTYSVFVNDSQLTSNIIDLIPYESDIGRSNTAELTVSDGEPIEIRVTSGADHRPMANEWVYIRWPHRYSWYEDGERRNDVGGRARGTFTDSNGIARTQALAGSELKAVVYAGEWRSDERKVTVNADEVTRIEFHRRIDEERTVIGRVIPPEDTDINVANAEITFGSIDGETDEQQTITADADGYFTFTTKAIKVGIFAYTADGKAAGIVKPDSLSDPVELRLKPTADLHGQLLGRNDEPLVNHGIRARIAVRGQRDLNTSFSTSFTAKVVKTKTDDNGNYTLKNLPTDLEITVRPDSLNDSDDDEYLGNVYLKVEESRPPLISRLEPQRAPDARSLSEKVDAVLRDAKLGDFHLLVLIFDSASDDFVGRYLLDYDRIPVVSSFMNLRIRENDTEDEATRQFVASNNWPQPELGIVFACVLDGAGQELARIELDTRDDNVQLQAAEFLQQHAPAQTDAEAKWDAAFAEAERSGRRVWARISRRYCGPCFRLSRWLDDNRQLLEQDYIFLKIDNVRDRNGVDIANRIAGDREHFGVPFHTIFDASAERLIDSDGPTGNIGFPSGHEGLLHLKEMLNRTKTSLTDAQIEQIIARQPVEHSIRRLLDPE